MPFLAIVERRMVLLLFGRTNRGGPEAVPAKEKCSQEKRWEAYNHE